MSKKIQYPNGDIGFASDAVAAILAKRPGHKIVDGAVPEPKKPEPKKDEK
jgi:hypothetical protein